jgi:hypothetical protein
MQLTKLGRVFAVLLIGAALVDCSSADNPYERIQNPPLLRASLNSVVVVTADIALPERLVQAGYTRTVFPGTNYPASVPAEAALWKLPEESVSNSVLFMAPPGQGPNVRVIVMPEVPPVTPVDAELEAAFYRKVLGTELPQWPGSKQLRDGARIQAWTFLVDDLLTARKRLQEAGVPILHEPLAITTAYLGTHQTMAIQAPDGTPIELVQGASL